ncbi:MAG: hypothetical protein GY895_07010 [Phycisphaera sp.]|nr:hypothetical protein [Phycisphaera sp.]
MPTIVFALALIAPAAGVPVAHGGDETRGNLQAEIDALRGEIDELRDRRLEDDIDADRMQEIRALVSDVMADAGRRTTFQDDVAIPGWKKGFQLRSPDGNFLLKVGGQVQIRFVLNHANGLSSAEPNPPAGKGAPYQWGLENRRTKLAFQGHVVDPGWTYKVKGAFTREIRGINLLEEAWIARSLGDGWKIRVGQFKPPWMREELVSSSRQLAVDRSVVNGYFKQGYSQGVELAWSSDDFRIIGWTGDGIGPRNLGRARANGQNTPWNKTATSYSFTGRTEWRLAGDWKQFKDFNSRRGSEFAAMVGVSGAIQRANQNLGPASGTVAGGVTGDVTLAFDGGSIFVSGVWTSVTAPKADGGGTNNPFGFTVQGGYFVGEDVEVIGRFAYMNYDLENQVDPKVGRFDGLTVGANWFINPAVKFALDWTINFDSLATPGLTGSFVSNSAGFRPDQPGAVNQWALRGQLQLLF